MPIIEPTGEVRLWREVIRRAVRAHDRRFLESEGCRLLIVVVGWSSTEADLWMELSE